MWPRLALNNNLPKGSMWFLATLGFFLLSACTSPANRRTGDELSNASYTQHYRCLDSVAYYGERETGAERLNNLAFYHIAKMDYATAESLLNQIPEETDNQLELLIGYVQQMRLCQRRSRNKEFYDYREKALTCLNRISEERSMLSDEECRRLLYAETELAIVTSTYYYYVGLEQQSVEALTTISPEAVKRDTAQFLNYLYNIGAGGILTQGTAQDIYQQEVDHLLRCYQIARRENYPYFVANALEGLAEHLIDRPDGATVSLAMVNPGGMADDSLALWLAEEALDIFRHYGDVYQVAGAYRTLASCYRVAGDHEAALYYLHQALADSTVLQAPDLVASIYEQLSVAYAAVDEKQQSDYYRNVYLDLQEQTRQDRQLEARAGQLEYAVSQLNWILAAVVGAIVLLLFLLWLFRYLGRRQQPENPLAEQIEERREQLAVSRRLVADGERCHLEQRAKISLVNSLLPLIDRMVYTISRQGDKDYVCELTDKIEADNELLTRWIQLRQGQLNLHIESFPLQPLFDMIARSQKSFMMKGVSLTVEPTGAVVKADRILTLFMLNTLADNARKFTSEGGRVTVSAEAADDYVELAVQDTGIGMTADELARVFDRRVVVEEQPETLPRSQASHGFGLLNCKGIIERYRKTSQLFSVCTLKAESEQGKGSRFSFRLPKGRAMAFGFWLLAFSQPLSAGRQPSTAASPLARAAIYADSAYFSNINGTYERTLLFADSCRECLNEHYRSQHPADTLFMLPLGNTAITPPEIVWLDNAVQTNYNLILDIRNESAVAALALHEWQLYQYNNRIYTQLFKKLSADNTLADYCRTTQQTKENRTIAVVLLLLLLLAILPTYYFYYLRPRLNARFKAESNSRDDLEMLDDELRQTELELGRLHVSNAVLDNCLSTLKHETMYYPSRIRQLIVQDDLASAAEVVSYYRELYNLLSQQAMSQVERVKLHLKHLDHDILGDPVLIDYLKDILKRMTGQRQLNLAYRRRDEQYVEMVLHVQSVESADQPALLDTHPIDYLLCRQIARDHGEATNRLACSIREEQEPQSHLHRLIIITLPAYGKL